MDTWIFWMGLRWFWPGFQLGFWALFLLFFWSPFWFNFWTRPGAQNRPKTRPLAENEVTGTGVLSIFQLFLFFPAFSWDFEPKCSKIQWNFERVFSSCARFFSNGQKPNSMHRRSVLSSFYFFIFFQKKKQKSSKKMMKKVKPEKSPKMTTRGVPE